MPYLLSFLLSSMGLTVLIVWPQDGPGAWLRENVLRKALLGKAKEMLDCYICTGFWSGLVLSPAWWLMCRERWTWSGCLMTPALFWLVLRNPGGENDGDVLTTRRVSETLGVRRLAAAFHNGRSP